MAKPCSQSVFKLNVALYLMFRDESSPYSCFFTAGILRLIRPVTLKTPLL